MNKIKGKDVILEVYKDGAYVPWKCATTCSIHIKPEIVDKTTYSSGFAINRHVRRLDWSVDISGVSILDDHWNVFDSLNIVRIINGFQIRMTFTDTAGNTAVFTGTVIMEDASISGDAQDFAMFDESMLGNGAFTLVTTVGGVVTSTFDYSLDFSITG